LAGKTQIQLCGELCLQSGDKVVAAADFPGRQGRLAFAYLAINARAVPRDELADAIWRDKLPKSWEHDLAAIVSKLRAMLATVGLKDTLQGRSRSYELRPPSGSVDVLRSAASAAEAEEAQADGDTKKALAAAATAAEVARREFMVGESGDWVERVRSEQTAELVRALAVSAELLGEIGDLKAAVAHATEALALEPYAETNYVRLMKLQSAAGNRAEAVRTYERCRTLLAEELGVDPSPETEAVYLAALRAKAVGKPRKSSDVVTVMLVDDHPLWRETLRQTLERAGVGRIVGEASDGKEAIELAAETEPTVVIMDMELPVLDGVKATQKLIAARPDTKVLVLSASSDEELVVRAIRAGAHGYLLKTAIADDVADAVRRVAGGEIVLPAEVAGIVLAELRGTTKKRSSGSRRH
jgi:SARP family transcriptional regulator, regulator of embCAB operon